MGSTIGSPCSEEFRAHAGSLRTFGKKKANLGVLENLNPLANYSRLKADWTSYRMVVDREGEPDPCECAWTWAIGEPGRDHRRVERSTPPEST